MPLEFPVIIVLTSEKDSAAADWVVRNLPYLTQTWGYQTVELEYFDDEPFFKYYTSLLMSYESGKKILNEVETELKKLKTSLEVTTPNIIVEANLAKNLRGIVHYFFTEGMAALAQKLIQLKVNAKLIDLASYRTLLNKDIQAFPEKLKDIKEPREKNFAKHILAESTKTDGRVIALLGSNHYTVYKELKELGIMPEDCIYVNLYNPEQIMYCGVNSSITNGNKVYIDLFNKDKRFRFIPKEQYEKNLKSFITKRMEVGKELPANSYFHFMFSADEKTSNKKDQTILKAIEVKIQEMQKRKSDSLNKVSEKTSISPS